MFVPGHNPGHGEAAEKELGVEPISGVLEQLGGLQEDVGTVVKQENECSDLEEVAGPREAHEQDCCHVMHEHHLEISF